MSGQYDSVLAYRSAFLLTPTQDLSNQELGGMILAPGVYSFSSSAAVNGNLILDAQGNSNAQFVFQIGTTLTTGSFSSISVINSGAMPGSNVFWQVGTSATLGTETQFSGNILANNSITLNLGADILYGRALALNGAVTLDGNSITNGASITSPVPEPGTLPMLLSGSLLVFFRQRRNAPRSLPALENA